MEDLGEVCVSLTYKVWYNSVVEFECVSSRILKINFNFLNVNYEVNYEGRKRFRNDMDRVLSRVVNGYRLCVIEDLNRWVRDRLREDITCPFGVPI